VKVKGGWKRGGGQSIKKKSYLECDSKCDGCSETATNCIACKAKLKMPKCELCEDNFFLKN